jgi:hypothetical protein
MRFVTQDNILPAPFNSAQGIGNVGKANPNGAQPPWGGSVTNYIKTNVC